jgi:hypothetical protein
MMQFNPSVTQTLTMTIKKTETTKTSRTRIVFDLEDVLTVEELLKFQASADQAGARSLTEHLLNVTLRIDKEDAA